MTPGDHEAAHERPVIFGGGSHPCFVDSVCAALDHPDRRARLRAVLTHGLLTGQALTVPGASSLVQVWVVPSFAAGIGKSVAETSISRLFD